MSLLTIISNSSNNEAYTHSLSRANGQKSERKQTRFNHFSASFFHISCPAFLIILMHVHLHLFFIVFCMLGFLPRHSRAPANILSPASAASQFKSTITASPQRNSFNMAWRAHESSNGQLIERLKGE
jgi:hypothetical protein